MVSFETLVSYLVLVSVICICIFIGRSLLHDLFLLFSMQLSICVREWVSLLRFVSIVCDFTITALLSHAVEMLFSWMVEWWGAINIHQTSLRRKLFLWFSYVFLSFFLTVFVSWLYKQIIPEEMNLAHTHTLKRLYINSCICQFR